MSAQSLEELRREVWNALVHCIVSNRGLWETVDVAEVKRRMEPAIAALPWKALDLTPLWRYLLEVRTPDKSARETVLFFASRGLRWDITVQLPPELEQLSPAERAAHVERMRSLGGSSGTFVGRAPVARGQSESAPMRPAEPIPKAPERQPTHSELPAPPFPYRAWGLVAARVSAIVAAGLFAAQFTGRSDEPDLHRYQEALGELCSAVEVHGRAALCTATPAALADPTKTAIRVEAVRISLKTTVLFVDADGEALDPFEQPLELAHVELEAGDEELGG